MKKPNRLLILAAVLVGVAIIAHNGVALVPAALAVVLWIHEWTQDVRADIDRARAASEVHPVDGLGE